MPAWHEADSFITMFAGGQRQEQVCLARLPIWQGIELENGAWLYYRPTMQLIE
jgi:hypothetical protein